MPGRPVESVDRTSSATSSRDQTGPRIVAWLNEVPRLQWLIFGAALCALLPLFFSWPSLPMTAAGRAWWTHYWDEVLQAKISNPLFDYRQVFDGESNEAKRNFRLTVPLLARVTGFGLRSVPTIQFGLQCVLLLSLLAAAERACRDRVTALAAALAVVGTDVGTNAWRDIYRWFDNCAHAFMAMALVARTPFAIAGPIFLAALTDERALMAVPLVIVYHKFVGTGRQACIGTALGVGGYVAIRAMLSPVLGFLPPTRGIGDSQILASNLGHAGVGGWFALEGGWLLVVGSLICVIAARKYGMGTGLLLATTLPIIAAMAVWDFSRSAMYAFPATLAALAVAASYAKSRLQESVVRWLALGAAAVSLIVPNSRVMRNVGTDRSLANLVAAHRPF